MTTSINNFDEEIIKISVEDSNCSVLLKQALDSALPRDKEITFVCIGTDRLTGDSFGPFLGTFLQEAGISNVYGTLNNPVHAQNLEDTISKLNKNHFIVAVDACLGSIENIKKVKLFKGNLFPGTGVNKKLPPIGDIGISYIVNVGGGIEYLTLQNTRLSIIKQGVDMITKVIKDVIKERENEYKGLHLVNA